MKVFLLPVLFIIVLLPAVCFSQAPGLDRAKQKIYEAVTDKERLTNLVEFCKLRNSLHGDTIYLYAQWAKKLALQLNDKKNLAWAEYSIISGDLARGKIERTIQQIDSNAAFQNIKPTDAALYYKIQLLKANALNRLNKRTEALELQLKLLNEAEQEENDNARLFAINFIGATYNNVGKGAEARDIWLKGLQIITQKNDAKNEEIEAYILSNLALYYYNQYYYLGNTPKKNESRDSSLLLINKAMALSNKNENLGVLAASYLLRGQLYAIVNEFSLAQKDISEALAVRKKIGDPFYIVNDIAGVVNFYLVQKQYKQVIEAAKEGIAIAEKNGVKGEQIPLMQAMANSYKNLGNYEQYSKTLEQLIAAGMESLQENSAEKIAEVQTKYEVQKKETLIAQQKLDLLWRNIFLYGGGILITLLLTFLGFRFKQYKHQQQLKIAAIQEEERKQNELAVKEAGEKERKRIAAELHDNLGVQANAILHNSTLLTKTKSGTEAIVADLQETAQEMLHNLRETLWAMKTADVSATDLWLRMINFLKQMGRHYPAIEFKVEGEVAGTQSISSAKALHLILVLQETINNAVKHANAGVITVASKYDEKKWKILITDNGKGFNLTEVKTKTDSYGLANMKQRAAEGNFDYQIASAEGSGTQTTLSVANQ
jgi:two-component system, NarL family, sensor kinase